VPSTSKAGRTSTWLPAALLAGILFGMAFIYSVTRRVQQLVAARVKPVNDRAPASADGLGRGLVTKPRLSGSSLTPPLAR
jgi:hypothetical protein